MRRFVGMVLVVVVLLLAATAVVLVLVLPLLPLLMMSLRPMRGRAVPGTRSPTATIAG